MAKKAKKLKELTEMMDGHVIDEFEKVNVVVLKELVSEVSEIGDQRDSSYVRHKLADIIMITLFAVMANADEWMAIEEFGKKKEKWLRTFLTLEHGIPTDDTFRIVISKLNVQHVYGIILRFLMKKLEEVICIQEAVNIQDVANVHEIVNVQEVENVQDAVVQVVEKELISCDGKSSNGSKRNETDKQGTKPLNTLNAYSSDWGMCVDQQFIEEKSNEIPAMPLLLKRLDLRNTIVTWDALNTQKDTVQAVIDGNGDYVGALKGNQGNLFGDVKDYFDEETKKEIKKSDKERKEKRYKATTEKEHSAIVTREYYLESDIDWLYDKKNWAGLSAIGVEVKKIEKLGSETGPTFEERYYICSIKDIDDFARSVRGHWGVENGLHWHLDYTFNDDKNTTTKDNGAKGLQIFKKIALALLKVAQALYPPRTSLKRIRYRLSLDYENEIERIFTALNVDSVKEVLMK